MKTLIAVGPMLMGLAIGGYLAWTAWTAERLQNWWWPWRLLATLTIFGIADYVAMAVSTFALANLIDAIGRSSRRNRP